MSVVHSLEACISLSFKRTDQSYLFSLRGSQMRRRGQNDDEYFCFLGSQVLNWPLPGGC